MRWDSGDWDLNELNQLLLPVIPLAPITGADLEGVKKAKDLTEKLTEKAVALYEAKEQEFPNPEAFREVERVVLLRVIDRKWMEEIDDMEQLRQGIGLQAFAQRNPIDEYKAASYEMMDAMNEAIRTETVQMLYRVRIEKKVERERLPRLREPTRMIPRPADRRRERSRRFIPIPPAPAAAV